MKSNVRTYPGAPFSTAQAAEMLGVSRKTVVNYIKAGLLRGFKRNGGQWKIAAYEVYRLMKGN